MNMKKWMTLALSAVMVLSLAACGQSAAQSQDAPQSQDASQSQTAPQAQIENVQIPSPITDCETLSQAAAVTGFDMAVPQALEGYDAPTFQVISGTLLQVIYHSDGERGVTIRKAAGADDISGDYTVYAQSKTVSVEGLEVTMQGEQDLVYLATWTNDGYTYAVSVRSGLAESAMAELAAQVR